MRTDDNLRPRDAQRLAACIASMYPLRPHIRSWPRTGRVLLARLRREALAAPGSSADTLLQELLAIDAFPESSISFEAPAEPTIALEIDVKGENLRLLTTITTFGTPQDVTLQELRVEMSFPADESSDRLLRRQPSWFVASEI
ncbi:MAG: hypothetical protein WBF89_06225 [Steroidobacteraceae bacterium]